MSSTSGKGRLAKQLSRRDFLKISAPVSCMLVLGRMPVSAGLIQKPPTASSRTAEKAMLYDVSKCVGCRACQAACRRWNKLPPEPIGYGGIYDNPDDLSGRTWTLIKFREFGENGEKEWFFRKYQCMHCTDASCEAVCPTGAISHQGEAVIINQEWCIGCGYCVQACPFGVPHKDEDEGTARKCTFCIDRITQELKPACVEACPAGAIIYGDRAKLIAEGKRRAQILIASGKEKAYLYGETELGGLSVMYVLPEPAAVFGLPETPRLATANIFTQWLGGIVTAGIIAAVPFWLLFKRRKQIEKEQQSGVEGGTR